MSEYWQDKRINHRQVACGWALVLVVVAMMLAITSLGAPDCPQRGSKATGVCAQGIMVGEAGPERQRR